MSGAHSRGCAFTGADTPAMPSQATHLRSSQHSNVLSQLHELRTQPPLSIAAAVQACRQLLQAGRQASMPLLLLLQCPLQCRQGVQAV